MLEDLKGPPANPSSVHWFGQQAKNLLQEARRKAASFFKAKPEEIIFTSGGTESINFMLRSLPSKGHLITTRIEHSSVYKSIQLLESQGLDATYLPVGLWGAPLIEQIEAAIRPDTIALVFSASNGETGVKIELAPIMKLAQKHNIPLYLDAVSFVGKEVLPELSFPGAIAISGHKFHAPKGIGILCLRPPAKIASLLLGGNQEHQKRAGTENLAGILGLSEALQILAESQEKIVQEILDLRLHFENGLKRELGDLIIHGEGPRISNTSNIAFLGVDGETLLMHLDLSGVAASHGSACSSGSLEPSRVLTQMGIDKKTARSSLRFSLSRMNTREEIDLAIEKIVHSVKKLRALSL